LELERVTTVPSGGGAGSASTIVPVEELPPMTVDGLKLKLETGLPNVTSSK
jgi:hypothetical protein